MSAWSATGAAAVAIVLAVVATGQPLWEFRTTQGDVVDTWSYGILGVAHTVENRTSAQVTRTSYAYADVPNQPRLSALFLELSGLILLGLLAGAGGLALAVVTGLKRLRGVFAGLALLAACALMLYAALNLVIAIPAAAEDLASAYGQTIPDFRGQITIPQSTGPTIVLNWGPLMGWILLLVIGLAFAYGASDVWHVVPRKRKAPATGSAPKSVPAGNPATVPPPPVEVVSEAVDEPDLEEVFVIAPSGLLVKHLSRTLMSDKDRDVVGGMIAVVSSFVKEAFSERGGDVQEVTLGQHRFVMLSDEGVVLAVLVRRGSTEDVLHRLRHLMALLFDRYGDRLTQWDGSPLDGIEDELSVLWEPFFVPPPPAA